VNAADFDAVCRFDSAEVLRSRWVWLCAGVYGLLAAAFVFVGMRESTVLGFTGMGRALLSLCHGLTLVLPLLALMATSHVINRARDDGTLELLLGHPLRRGAYFAGVSAVRLAVLLLPLGALLLGMALLAQTAFHQSAPWGFLGLAFAVSAALLVAFVGLGFFISTTVRNQARAATYTLVAWLASAALLDFGLVAAALKWGLSAKAVMVFAALNPVQAARMALLASAEPDLAVFGPVGFFMSTRVGTAGLLAWGLAWPALFGLVLWGVALRRFNRGDVV
jgi:ABC-type transport system involved in multi-copper enzyme maturation permease subunit